jgi:GntR family transcriptional repressor for pyruvate dehydrogenase complex
MSDIDQFQVITKDRLYVKIADQLRTLIENDVYKPGQRFPAERALAEKLGVSRPTIREAMIALELSGLIEIRTGSGIYVSYKNPVTLPKLVDKGIGPFEILEMRYILESEICALAATKITDEQVERLYELIAEMEIEEKQPDSSEKADCQFHLLIAEASQNSALYESVKWLWELRSKSVLSNSFFQTIRKEGVQPSIEDHKKIAMALSQRNAERASLAMKNHIENATVNAAKHFEK